MHEKTNTYEVYEKQSYEMGEIKIPKKKVSYQCQECHYMIRSNLFPYIRGKCPRCDTVNAIFKVIKNV